MQHPQGDTGKAEMLWGVVEQGSSELSLEEKEQFISLLLENADVFADSKSDIGRTTKLKHNINTG